MRFASAIVALLAIAASITSITNGFALDDVPIIVKNDAVHSVRGIFALFFQPYWPPEFGQSLYRPLTSAAFAVQWAAGNGSPLPFHLMSIALYAAVSTGVYRLAGKFMSAEAALIAGALFAVHPLHVEAVANVVGQAELWSGLLLVTALTIFIEARGNDSLGAGKTASIAALYGMALLFKESAIVLPGLIVAAELILPDSRASRQRLRRSMPVLAASASVAIAFLFVRTSVLGSFTGGGAATVLAGQEYSTRFFTMLGVMPEWLRLFTWPASLSADYSPPRVTTETSFRLSMMPVIAVVVALAAIAVKVRRGHPALTFAVAITGIALLIPSNLVIVTGFALAERALFLPTVGFAIGVGYGIAAIQAMISAREKRLVLAVTSALFAAGLARSATRAPVWKDNETLFRQTVSDVPLSYRAHMRLGELLTDKGDTAEGLTELAIAVSLSRSQDYFVRWFAADRFHAAGQLEIAAGYYKEALALKPTDARVRYGAAVALGSLGRVAEARALAAEGLEQDPADARFAQIVHRMDSIGTKHPGA